MADPLSFGRELDEAQKEVARKIMERAVALGVDPRLAVSVAYQESRLRPDVGRSPKGAVGVMQVMPRTGKDFGFSMEDLQNPDTNIDAGLQVLKKMLELHPDDPRLAVVAYNAGPNHEFFKGGALPKETEGYLKNLMNFGAFADAEAAEVAPETTDTTEAEEPETAEVPAGSDETTQRIEAAMREQEIRQAQMYGGGAGAALGAARGIGDVGGSAVEAIARRAAQGAQAAQAPPLAGAPAPQMPPQPAVDISGRPPGRAVQNYGRAFGLGEIEAGRALDMTKQPGGVHDITTKRREALEKLQGMAPARGMSEDLTRGGLMVPQQTSYTGPRGPQGEIGGGKPPPVAPIAPKPAGPLEQVTSLLRRLTETPLMRYGMPAAGGALAAGELTRAKQMLQQEEPDYLGAALAGATGVGGVMSMVPRGAVYGAPLALGAGLAQMAREYEPQTLQDKYSPEALREEGQEMPSFNLPQPMGRYGRLR